jgi:hypothetical protein
MTTEVADKSGDIDRIHITHITEDILSLLFLGAKNSITNPVSAVRKLLVYRPVIRIGRYNFGTEAII